MKRLLAVLFLTGLMLALSCVSVPTDYTGRLRIECFSPDSGQFIVVQTGDTIACYMSKLP